MLENHNPSLQEFLDEVKECQNPSDLIALFNSQNGEAGLKLSNLFEKSFLAGLNRTKGEKA